MTQTTRYIAHRVFGDRAPISPFLNENDPPFHGVELDVRCGTEGEAWIYHAPVFQLRSRRIRQVPKPFADAMAFLAEHMPAFEVVMLDIKSVEAAAKVGAYLSATRPPFEVVCNCWHPDEVAELRRHSGVTTIYYCIAPIFARRALPGRFRDLYLSNSYPFLSTRRNFDPKLAKQNRHNINIKLISKRKLTATLPRGIHGICVHRIFCSPELMGFVAARKLQLAVYGLGKTAREKVESMSGGVTYAIIRRSMPDRRSETSNNLHKASGN